jgi:predicted amidohydrolase YtcJ
MGAQPLKNRGSCIYYKKFEFFLEAMTIYNILKGYMIRLEGCIEEKIKCVEEVPDKIISSSCIKSMEVRDMNYNKSGATAVYLNGNIYTVDKDFSVAEALVAKNDYLIYVGTNEIAKRFITESTKVIDLKGETVLPGLIEGHTHFGWLSQSLVEIDALFKQKDQILKEVEERAAHAKKGDWILGRGWSNDIWPDTSFPTKEELDEVSPDNPVCIIRSCCHAYWANSKALELAKISRDTPDPDGGEIIDLLYGSPAGVLVDTAGDQLMAVIPAYEGENQLNALRKGQSTFLLTDLQVIMDAGASISEIDAMKTMCESEEMKLRLYVYAK